MNNPFKTIGRIRTPWKQKFGTPRQSGMVPQASGVLELDMTVCPEGCLDGLENFSHIWLLFHFEKNRPGNLHGKVKPPRLQGEKMGLFASRSPHRPSPIGLSLVHLKEVNHQTNTITVTGVDLIDGTPILDIKPFVSYCDQVEESKQGWLDGLEERPLKVEWAKSMDPQSFPQEFLSLIENNFNRDIRNLEDQRKNDSSQIFRTLIDCYDVHFRYQERNVIIEKIELNPTID